MTIADVAAATGLTKGTVSRALNGYPDIAEGTRLRVRRKAEDLGYAPLAHAQAMRTGRSRSLALVLQVGEPDEQRPFLADFLAGVTLGASRENWTLTVANAPAEGELLGTMTRLIHEQKADGFILPRTKLRDPRVELLRDVGFPFVLYGRTDDPTDCAWYDILSENAIEQAVDRLVALGHRRVGFINGLDGFTYARLRRAGFDRALAANGLPVADDLCAGNAVTIEAGADAARALLATDCPPTAIVCATDMAALGACRAMGELGLRVGHDVSVIGYDGIPEGKLGTPPLTTFAVDTKAAGEILADLLIRRIRGESPETLRAHGHARLVRRGTDGPPRRTSEELRALLAQAKPLSDIQGRIP